VVSGYTLCAQGNGAVRGPGPRTDWSDAEVLREGWAANPTVLRELQGRCRLSNAAAAALCGVSLRTYRRWRSEGNPDVSAVRLLAVLAGFVPWDGWEGWEVHRGCFFPPGFSKGGISPGEFQALVFWRQMVSEYRRKNAELVRLLARADARIAELQELVFEDQRPPKAEAVA
jgi:hypothetical protein